MAVILVRGVGVSSEDTEGPSELASVPAGPPNSASMWGPTGYDLNPQVTLARPQSHRVQRCQSSGMAVTVSVEKGWRLHPGMGTRISGEVTTSGPWGIAISGPRFFSVTDGAPCSADR